MQNSSKFDPQAVEPRPPARVRGALASDARTYARAPPSATSRRPPAMGAADERLEARLGALTVDDPHASTALQAAAPDTLGAVDTDLVLDRDELEMLKVFHRSFNLPGLRHGLVNPVCREDYYPPEEEAEAAQRQALQAQRQTADLLQRAASASSSGG